MCSKTDEYQLQIITLKSKFASAILDICEAQLSGFRHFLLVVSLLLSTQKHI